MPPWHRLRRRTEVHGPTTRRPPLLPQSRLQPPQGQQQAVVMSHSREWAGMPPQPPRPQVLIGTAGVTELSTEMTAPGQAKGTWRGGAKCSQGPCKATRVVNTARAAHDVSNDLASQLTVRAAPEKSARGRKKRGGRRVLVTRVCPHMASRVCRALLRFHSLTLVQCTGMLLPQRGKIF